MALSDAVLAVADELERTGTDLGADGETDAFKQALLRTLAGAKLIGYARELRAAVKAAEPPPLPLEAVGGVLKLPASYQGGQLLTGDEAAAALERELSKSPLGPYTGPTCGPDWEAWRRTEEAKVKKMVRAEEGLAGMESQAEVVDGPDEGTYVPVAAAAPEGCFVLVGESVYQLDGQRKLHFHQGQTERYHKERGGK